MPATASRGGPATGSGGRSTRPPARPPPPPWPRPPRGGAPRGPGAPPPPGAALLARLAAAGAAWDRGDAAALERFLAACEGALDELDLAWRWHQLRALQAGGAGDLDGAAESAARAIRAGRHRLTRRQAAGL